MMTCLRVITSSSEGPGGTVFVMVTSFQVAMSWANASPDSPTTFASIWTETTSSRVNARIVGNTTVRCMGFSPLPSVAETSQGVDDCLYTESLHYTEQGTAKCMPDRLGQGGWDAEIALVWTTSLGTGSGTPPPSSTRRQNVLLHSPKMRHLRLDAS